MRLIKKIFSQHFVLAILCFSVLLWTAGSIIQHRVDSLKTKPGITWFREEVDFKIYFSGQGWVLPGRLLYDQGYVEYPPLGVLYVWWPRLFTDNFEIYHWLLWLSNSLGYILAGWLTWKLAKLWQLPDSAWWLWLLPSAVYYSLNRFDILPVVLTWLSFYWFRTNQFRWSGLSYGAAIAAKFYPVLLLPLFWQLFKKERKSPIDFIIYSLIPLLSLSLSVVVIGGSAALWSPYVLQLNRAFEAGSAGALLIAFWPEAGTLARSLASLGQIIVPVGWAIWLWFNKSNWPLRTSLKLASLTLLAFIFFNHFYSNQWWLWVMPWLALVFPPNLIYLLGVYDLLNYLEFPVLAEVFNKGSMVFNLAVALRSGLFLGIMFMLIEKLISKKQKVSYENLANNPNL